MKCLQIWNAIRTTQLTQEMDQLRNALEEMKHRIGFDTMDDLEEFENSVSHSHFILSNKVKFFCNYIYL